MKSSNTVKKSNNTDATDRSKPVSGAISRYVSKKGLTNCPKWIAMIMENKMKQLIRHRISFRG